MLKKQLSEDLIKATKNRNQESINTIRLILASIKDKEIQLRSENKNKEMSDEIIINILKNMIKQRNESIELYQFLSFLYPQAPVCFLFYINQYFHFFV